MFLYEMFLFEMKADQRATWRRIQLAKNLLVRLRERLACADEVLELLDEDTREADEQTIDDADESTREAVDALRRMNRDVDKLLALCGIDEWREV